MLISPLHNCVVSKDDLLDEGKNEYVFVTMYSLLIIHFVLLYFRLIRCLRYICILLWSSFKIKYYILHILPLTVMTEICYCGVR
jgi:hypothetical protein